MGRTGGFKLCLIRDIPNNVEIVGESRISAFPRFLSFTKYLEANSGDLLWSGAWSPGSMLIDNLGSEVVRNLHDFVSQLLLNPNSSLSSLASNYIKISRKRRRFHSVNSDHLQLCFSADLL